MRAIEQMFCNCFCNFGGNMNIEMYVEYIYILDLYCYYMNFNAEYELRVMRVRMMWSTDDRL